jgi:hypothetical protein
MLIGFVQFLRLIHAWMLHRTLRQAIKEDAPVAAPLVDKIDRKSDRQGELPGDDRNGLVLVALGLALGGFALIQQDSNMRMTLGAALFPLFVGLALLCRDFLVKRAIAREIADDAMVAEAAGGR